MTTFADPDSATQAGPKPPPHVVRGPEHADNYRIKVGRYKERWYRDPLPADPIAPATGDDEAYPSVSTVKGASGKDWTYTSLKRIAQSDDLADIATKGFYERYERFKVINQLDLSSAMRRGTNVHTWAECRAYGMPQFLNPNGEGGAYFPIVDKMFDELQPELLAAEFVCFHRTLNGIGYGGTSDGFFRIGGGRFMVDWKSRGPDADHGCYPEEAGQLGAYLGCEYIIVQDDDPSNPHGAKRMKMPDLDGALIVSIKPDSYEVYPVDIDKAIEHFHNQHAWWKARRDESRVVGPKWPPRVAVVDSLEEPLRESLIQTAQRRMASDQAREAARRLSQEGGPASADDVAEFEARWELSLNARGKRWLGRVVNDAVEAKADFRLSAFSTQRRADIYCALTEWASTDYFDPDDVELLLAAVWTVVTSREQTTNATGDSVGEIVGHLTTDEAAAFRALVSEIAADRMAFTPRSGDEPARWLPV